MTLFKVISDDELRLGITTKQSLHTLRSRRRSYYSERPELCTSRRSQKAPPLYYSTSPYTSITGPHRLVFLLATFIPFRRGTVYRAINDISENKLIGVILPTTRQKTRKIQ